MGLGTGETMLNKKRQFFFSYDMSDLVPSLSKQEVAGGGQVIHRGRRL